MQSQNSTRLSMLSINVSASHGPLNVTSGMIWTTKGIDTLNPTTIIATVPLYKFPSLLLLYTLLIDTVQIFANTFHLSSKYSHMKKKLFHELLVTLLTHQHDLIEFYLTMAKTALEISQVITCSLGVTYNVNVRHTKSLMLWIRWSPMRFIKVSLIKFIQEFIVVVSGVISYIRWEVS